MVNKTKMLNILIRATQDFPAERFDYNHTGYFEDVPVCGC